ncbi:MAG: GNAT family N-acetyltransferase [Micrococcales bacterium]|nr:GNAT family N-acetyltransferase [Micrococcales bacterium]MCL2666828.1 GNAT family N-acetyltransferase [Micrococcales bacterium]
MTADELQVRIIADADAGELFTLRRAAFVTEAQQYDDPRIPPLTQTLSELKDDLGRDDVITLGAWSGPRLVGSIRVLLEEGRATLGRFAVAPDLQGRGIGSRLLMEIVPYLPDGTKEIWVFTGRDSLQNLTFYASRGYELQHNQRVGDLTFAYLRRILGEKQDLV